MVDYKPAYKSPKKYGANEYKYADNANIFDYI
jgi:hypothetical protein